MKSHNLYQMDAKIPTDSRASEKPGAVATPPIQRELSDAEFAAIIGGCPPSSPTAPPGWYC
ncbi:MAG: hypothetical protein ACLQGP_18660 [Isosphaeraceae bacterium]